MADIERARKEIADAISAHSAWKMHLHSAVMSGNLKAPSSQIARSDICQFGKWLAVVSPDIAAIGDMDEINKLHADFHAEAGRIAAKVEADELDNAKTQMKSGPLVGLSKDLVLSLTKWKMSLR